MADRFPSLEEFDSGAQTQPSGTPGLESSGGDFLAREQALLGSDADQFTTGNDNAAFVEDADDDDLLGGGGGGNEEVTEFESSFPAIDASNEAVAPGGTITSTTPYQSSYNAYASTEPEAEPEVITQWRERRDLALSSREEKSAERQAETIKAAQQNIDDFYENYNSKKEKSIHSTRKDAEEFLAAREDTSAGGTSWERIAKLVDLSGKGARGGGSGTGKEKFRELLLSLRKDEKAPGATGY